MIHPYIAAAAALAVPLLLAAPGAAADTGSFGGRPQGASQGGFQAAPSGGPGGGRGASHRGNMIGGRDQGRGAPGAGAGTAASGKAAIESSGSHGATGNWQRPPGDGHGAHRFHEHAFRHHRPFPVILVPGVATTYVAVHEDDGEGDDVFSIVNDTAEEMTVFDNDVAMCTLAPGARCSFDTSQGRHEVSVKVGGRTLGAAQESGSGRAGKMILLEGDAASK